MTDEYKELKTKAESIRSVLLVATTAIALISSAVGAVVYVDARYAKSDQVEVLEKRVSLQELRAQLRTALEEYYFLKQQSRKYPDDLDLKEKVKQADQAVQDIKEQIQAIKKKEVTE